MGKLGPSQQVDTLERYILQGWRRPGKDSTQDQQSHCGIKNWTEVIGLGRLWGQMSLFGFRLCPTAVAASK